MSIPKRKTSTYNEFFIRGEWITVNAAAKKYGISAESLRNRLYEDGMTDERLLAPVERRKPSFTSGSGQRYETRQIHPLLTSLFRDYGKRPPVCVKVKCYSDEVRRRAAL